MAICARSSSARSYDEADRRKGDTGENLIGLLESRLDAIVYRAKFVPTVFAARQFVNHGHVTVNGVRVNIGSYRCKAGDVIEVREKSKQLVIVLESVQLAERDVPDYIEVDHNKMVATFARVPTLSDVPYAVIMEPQPGRRILFALIRSSFGILESRSGRLFRVLAWLCLCLPHCFICAMKDTATFCVLNASFIKSRPV